MYSSMAVQVDWDAAIPLGVTAASVRTALVEAGDRVAAVLIVSPTYHGVISDVVSIRAECARAGVPLVVDEAHGPHLRFLPGGLGSPDGAGGGGHAAIGDCTMQGGASSAQPAYRADTVTIGATGATREGGALSAPPRAALDCGADIVVHSVHKTLSSATQTGMLHASAGALASFPRIDQALSRALDTVQSSSPSYLLLATLDAARSQTHGAPNAALAPFPPQASCGPSRTRLRSGDSPLTTEHPTTA